VAEYLCIDSLQKSITIHYYLIKLSFAKTSSMKKIAVIIAAFFVVTYSAHAQKKSNITVIGYYAGDSATVDKYPAEKLTHIIFSFCHLKGNELHVSNKRDSTTIKHLVDLKQRNPNMKVILSMGGWSGCETCSLVFSTDSGRQAFANSTKELSEYFHTDGIDLDWEYPAISGFPGHRFVPEDKPNFTELVKTLRKTLGKKYEISFAAGGSDEYIDKSIDWAQVTKYVDKINIMSYDLVHGYSKISGHHTPLYSTPQQILSVDHDVKRLIALHVPKNKIVIGAAMYARIFLLDSGVNTTTGLYQPCKFEKGISWKNINMDSLKQAGFVAMWDDVAKAPYMYNAATRELMTYDDPKSMADKTQYVKDMKLNGIMFWQLADDAPAGLLDVIDETKNKK
jgi:chitinase